jgi:hypothetical protein
MSSNISFQSVNIQDKIQNKGFLLLDNIFKEQGWHLCENKINKICYTKLGFETDIFDIEISEKQIQVSIPIRNSPYQYVTCFNDYFQASEYLEARFKDFNSELII